MASRKRVKKQTLEQLAANFRADIRTLRGLVEIGGHYLQQAEEALSAEALTAVAKVSKGKLREALHRRVDELIPD